MNKLEIERRALDLAAKTPTEGDDLEGVLFEFLKLLHEKRADLRENIIRRAAKQLKQELVREQLGGFKVSSEHSTTG